MLADNFGIFRTKNFFTRIESMVISSLQVLISSQNQKYPVQGRNTKGRTLSVIVAHFSATAATTTAITTTTLSTSILAYISDVLI